ncbi:putative Methyl-accepting chemotaxis protein [Vibrio nigripulchritudo SFn27]|uniref:Putative Methyl-accepting chemotaxis protein n=1 Tax=Vibrio nigripulchritudo TaxID=28173 RepID=U4K5F6_9VIBR|nr:methyl-accepting chemotaxis protein [Vibrio nigripulchritudo]CCN84176.1 putative Methyl-accepting chemotaxis protein [Vibrio nigripulchritudo BLFn1]CCN87091.1 putative Methyl-accepting chemotaxis protein [Vibrio nigripulchritudo SFn27]CCN93204.1 putative Methyl-accepting chemotaxis protein [Vibrio nigripulchritudo ENn2]CCO39643.1 putative Methyl-accepting chemotaxis protein [Vibrio nigripulchritudo SFn135]CCO54348.1 putative Methyl-accepting chemotaxis protein [Vibrio nigripulchritudo Wn13]
MPLNMKIAGALSQYTIKAKLLAVTGALLVCIGTYAVYESTIIQELESLQFAAEQNAQSETELLLLRRHEKDFLARKDPKYIKKFESSYQSLQSRVGNLDTLLAQYATQSNTDFADIEQTLEQYLLQFNRLATQMSYIGLDEESGLLGELNSKEEKLNNLLVTADRPSLSNEFLRLVDSQNRFFLTQRHEQYQQFQENWQGFHSKIQEQPLSTAMIDALSLASDDFRGAFDELYKACVALGLDHNSGMRGELRKNVHGTEDSLNRMQTQIGELVNELRVEAKVKLRSFGIGIGLFISTLLILLSIQISGRLINVRNMMRNIAEGEGDLTVRMEDKGRDELAQLSQSFDKFVGKLQGSVLELAAVTVQLAQAAESSQKAASTSLDNAEQQQMESSSIATAVNQMLMTTNEIASNIENAASTAHKVKVDAEESMRLSHIAGDSIQGLTDNITNSQNLVRQLEEQSTEIQSVVSVISEITEQTNLLALNAAIEAARAGENGRGFAVVADEVRQLAKRTSDSTKVIERTISGLSSGVQNTVHLMQQSLTKAGDTNQQTIHAVEAIQRIVEEVSAIFDMNSQIATASEEQAMVSADIDRNITHIADLANNTKDAVNVSVQNSSEVRQAADRLELIVGQFRY